MAEKKAVLVEGSQIDDESVDAMIDEIVDVLFGDAEEGNAESTSPEE